MVAIITSSFKRAEQELELHMSNNSTYKIIKEPGDIRGRRFTAIIFIRGWYENEGTGQAVEILKERHPELFNQRSKQNNK